MQSSSMFLIKYIITSIYKYIFFLSSGIHEGRKLMTDPDTPSFAAELEYLSKDEV